MALLFMDGFNHYSSSDYAKKWSSSVGSPGLNTTGGRRGGGAATFWNSIGQTVTKLLPSSIQTVVVGFALSISTAAPGGAYEICSLLDSGTVQVSLRVDTLGRLCIYRGNTLLATASSALLANSYVHVELKVKIDPSVGTYEVRVNGNSTPVISGSSANTRNTANSTLNQVSLGTLGGSGFTSTICDLFILDTAGSYNNDFLGDCRIDTLFPSGDGNYSQFTPSTGTTHYTLVDESTPNTTDYNDGASVGDRDSYAMGNLSALASQTVYAVQVNAAVNKDDAGSKSVATFVRSSSTNGDGASVSLGTSQSYVSQLYERDPNGTVAWTESSVNAMEAGVKVTA